MPEKIRPPFFEIGPKAFLYGEEALALARAADEASRRYDVRIIYTPQTVDLRMIAKSVTDVLVFAQHMDPIVPGPGMGSILPQALKAGGVKGVMLNHAECPMEVSKLGRAIEIAREIGLISIVCADSLTDAAAIAQFTPDIIVPEPTELIGKGKSSSLEYIIQSVSAVKNVNPSIQVLPSAGIADETDVYRVIRAGAEATGCTSAIMKAKNPIEMMEKMIFAVRRAWDECQAEAVLSINKERGQ